MRYIEWGERMAYPENIHGRPGFCRVEGSCGSYSWRCGEETGESDDLVSAMAACDAELIRRGGVVLDNGEEL